MKTDHSFVAERALANHCSELTARSMPNNDLRDEARAEFADAVASNLARRIEALFAGQPVRVSHKAKSAQSAAQLAKTIGPIAANYAISCGAPGITMLVSFDVKTALILTDRLFGGDGDIPDEVDGELSQSACLVVSKAALAAAASITSSGLEGDHHQVLRDHKRMPRLDVFARKDECLSWTFSFEQEGVPAWTMLLAARVEDIDCALNRNAGAPKAKRAPADPTVLPFGAIPLSVSGILAETSLPLSRLATLAPGQTFPIAIPRQMPLRVGQKTIARGSVGTMEDRMAVRVSGLVSMETKS